MTIATSSYQSGWGVGGRTRVHYERKADSQPAVRAVTCIHVPEAVYRSGAQDFLCLVLIY